MLKSILQKFQGRQHRKFIKQCQPVIAKINQIEAEYQSLSEADLQAKTAEFKQRVAERVDAARERFADGPDERREEAVMDARKEALEELLPEAFAAVKNSARRLCGRTITYTETEDVWQMVHFDTQLMGGICLHEGSIAEMATGEGKTLVATLPLYLNALTGLNCQLVTVNDYLARRDSEWMGHIYSFLGLTVGCIQNGQDPQTRKEMYQRDITYGTSSEFGFDYLRDNGMASRADHQVQRDHWFAIVDEVDSILIDEARTPLIISGPMQDDSPLPFDKFKPLVKQLAREQDKLCNRLASEARQTLEQEDDGDQETGKDDPASEARLDAIVKLWQVRQGAPRNKTLLRLIENGGIRRELDKFDLEINSDYNKTRRYQLKEELYFVLEEKHSQADLTEKGRELLAPGDPASFVLPDLPTTFNAIDKEDLPPEEKQQRKQAAEKHFQQKSEEIHTLSQLLKAYCLYEKDQQYVVQDGKVVIVDENTGRMMPGRRWGSGLHQAVEAKEGVKIEAETKTYATITVQNYFRLYEKLAGMTGTAETEAGEFLDIYGMRVRLIPTHKPNIRTDENDIVYKTRREKYNACIEDIKEANGRGQPVLVGTASVEASELLSRMLKRSNIRHTVLNAKLHQREAEVVAEAGRKGAVTIATNMAGRGTDIKLGEGVADLGGLFVLGTERHESRRIDRQLRGRCARQGDPGRTKFMVSLEDNLMRLFANAGAISKMLDKSFVEGEPLSHPMLNWSIENAQKKVEQQNYSTRKRTLQYDDVLNKQREVIYDLRNDAIHSERPREIIFEMFEEELQARIAALQDDVSSESEGEDGSAVDSFLSWFNLTFPANLSSEELEPVPQKERLEFLLGKVREAYQQKVEIEDAEALDFLERSVVIRAIDRNWMNHLTEMEELRQSVGLRSYGQKDPLNEYKSEAYGYFEEMMTTVRSSICRNVFRTATSVDAFNNMLTRLNKLAKEKGPADFGDITLYGQAAQAHAQQQAARQQQAAGAQGQQGAAPAGRLPAQPGSSRDPSGAGRLPGAGNQRQPAPAPQVQTQTREMPKIGRNETVKIRRGEETREMKYKKAESLIQQEGWELVER